MIDRRLLAAALLYCAAPLGAQEEDFSKTQIKATDLGTHTYLLQGSGGNIAASVGADGILIVDDEFAPLASKIAASLKALGISDKPVRFVINTHYHYDHTGGNLPFADNGATVISHDNARARLASGADLNNGGPSFHYHQKPAVNGALPVITFDHDVTVHLNGEDIHALHFPAAHTDGDSVVFFPRANVVHTGDIYVRYGFPFLDVGAGGSVQGAIAACESLIAKLPPDVKVIPGHGALSNIGEMRDYLQMLKETLAVAQKAIHDGMTLEQAQKANLMAPWKQKYDHGGDIDSNGWLETLYASINHVKNAPFRKHN